MTTTTTAIATNTICPNRIARQRRKRQQQQDLKNNNNKKELAKNKIIQKRESNNYHKMLPWLSWLVGREDNMWQKQQQQASNKCWRHHHHQQNGNNSRESGHQQRHVSCHEFGLFSLGTSYIQPVATNCRCCWSMLLVGWSFVSNANVADHETDDDADDAAAVTMLCNSIFHTLAAMRQYLQTHFSPTHFYWQHTRVLKIHKLCCLWTCCRQQRERTASLQTREGDFTTESTIWHSI